MSGETDKNIAAPAEADMAAPAEEEDSAPADDGLAPQDDGAAPSGDDGVTPSGDGFADESGQHLRILEALLFASGEPVRRETLADKLPEGADIDALLAQLAERYANRGVNLVQVDHGWTFRTAPDLAPHLTVYRTVKRRLSRAALETLAIIAYHQPITRAEVEEVRGVSLSRGTLDQLLEAGWVKPRGRRRAPGRPLTWVTTDDFLSHFGLESLGDLPGVDELKAAGLLQSNPVVLGAAQELPLASPDEDEDEDADDGEAWDDEADDEADDELAEFDEEPPGATFDAAEDTPRRD
jgi:segregation and condensation protein B